MNQKITKNEVKDIVNIVLCISAQDGVLSDTEIEKSREEFPAFFNKKISKKQLDTIVDDFFNSNEQIESYLGKITSDDIKLPILQLTIISASSDGLEIRENIAFQKALSIWNYAFEDVIND